MAPMRNSSSFILSRHKEFTNAHWYDREAKDQHRY